MREGFPLAAEICNGHLVLAAIRTQYATLRNAARFCQSDQSRRGRMHPPRRYGPAAAEHACRIQDECQRAASSNDCPNEMQSRRQSAKAKEAAQP